MSGHIINPVTNRPIKVGGKVWKRLVSEGLVEYQKPENELYVAESKEEAKVAVKTLKRENKDPNEERRHRARWPADRQGAQADDHQADHAEHGRCD